MLPWLTFHAMRALEPRLFPPPRGVPSATTADASASLPVVGHITQSPVIRFPMLNYAHRGGSLEPREAAERSTDPASDPRGVLGTFVENTMPAFTHAARQLRADLLELDVQLTRDSQVVVVHDRTLGRICGPAHKGVRVRALRYDELPPLAAPQQPQQPSGAPLGQDGHEPPQPAPAGKEERIPLLSSVFSAFPDVPIQVDLKVDEPGLVEQVHDMVAAQPGRRRRLLWGSFIHKVQRELFERDAHVPLFTSSWRAIYLRLAHSVGKLHQVHIYESATIVPWRIPLPWRKGKPWTPFLDRSWCEALAERGVAVVFFGPTLNDEAAYRACLEAGGSAVCTDRPGLLRRFLAGLPADERRRLTAPLVDADRTCQHTGKGRAGGSADEGVVGRVCAVCGPGGSAGATDGAAPLRQ